MTALHKSTHTCTLNVHTHTHTQLVSSMRADTQRVLIKELPVHLRTCQKKHSHIKTDHCEQLIHGLGYPMFLRFSIPIHSSPGRSWGMGWSELGIMKFCWLFAGFWNITTHIAQSTTADQSPKCSAQLQLRSHEETKAGVSMENIPTKVWEEQGTQRSDGELAPRRLANCPLSCRDEVLSLNRNSVYLEGKSEEMPTVLHEVGVNLNQVPASPPSLEPPGVPAAPWLHTRARPSLSQRSNGSPLEERGAPTLWCPRASEGCRALQHASPPRPLPSLCQG